MTINNKDVTINTGLPFRKLYELIKDNKIDKLKEALRIFTWQNAIDSDKWSILHQAVEEGSLEMVDYLLNLIHVDSYDDQHSTPLHIAAHEGHPRMLELLIKRGANIHAVDIFGNTALHVAAASPDTDTEVFLILIEHGINIFARNSEGMSALDILYRAENWRDASDIITMLLQEIAGKDAGLKHILDKCSKMIEVYYDSKNKVEE
jgi:hypothetical protein